MQAMFASLELASSSVTTLWPSWQLQHVHVQFALPEARSDVDVDHLRLADAQEPERGRTQIAEIREWPEAGIPVLSGCSSLSRALAFPFLFSSHLDNELCCSEPCAYAQAVANLTILVTLLRQSNRHCSRPRTRTSLRKELLEFLQRSNSCSTQSLGLQLHFHIMI
jgi:hypothetical protein